MTSGVDAVSAIRLERTAAQTRSVGHRRRARRPRTDRRLASAAGCVAAEDEADAARSARPDGDPRPAAASWSSGGAPASRWPGWSGRCGSAARPCSCTPGSYVPRWQTEPHGARGGGPPARAGAGRRPVHRSRRHRRRCWPAADRDGPDRGHRDRSRWRRPAPGPTASTVFEGDLADSPARRTATAGSTWSPPSSPTCRPASCACCPATCWPTSPAGPLDGGDDGTDLLVRAASRGGRPAAPRRIAAARARRRPGRPARARRSSRSATTTIDQHGRRRRRRQSRGGPARSPPTASAARRAVDELRHDAMRPAATVKPTAVCAQRGGRVRR